MTEVLDVADVKFGSFGFKGCGGHCVLSFVGVALL
jgi:hypothetical protein